VADPEDLTDGIALGVVFRVQLRITEANRNNTSISIKQNLKYKCLHTYCQLDRKRMNYHE